MISTQTKKENFASTPADPLGPTQPLPHKGQPAAQTAVAGGLEESGGGGGEMWPRACFLSAVLIMEGGGSQEWGFDSSLSRGGNLGKRNIQELGLPLLGSIHGDPYRWDVVLHTMCTDHRRIKRGGKFPVAAVWRQTFPKHGDIPVWREMVAEKFRELRKCCKALPSESVLWGNTRSHASITQLASTVSSPSTNTGLFKFCLLFCLNKYLILSE